jgi:glycosyltransferase involved in cell wall biosynthesis
VHVLTSTTGSSAGGPDEPLVHRGSRSSLRRTLLEGGYDILHVHASVVSPLGLAMTVAACAHGLPVAVTVHSMWPNSPALVRPASVGLRLGRRPVAWAAVSRSAAAPLQRAVGAGVEVSVVPNAVDVEWWGAAAAQPRCDSDEVVVTSLMRVAGRKRPLALLRIMRRARRIVGGGVSLRLVIAGDGPQLPVLRRVVAASGASAWVDLPGRVSREQARALLHASDVYVAPADLESFGIAALEARTAGLPVVAKRSGGVGEFVRSGRDGLLVGSDEEMAEAVAALALDPVRRQLIRDHNRRFPPATTWEAAMQNHEVLYDRAIALAGRHRPVTAGARS